MAFGSSNPTLSDKRFREVAAAERAQATVDGRPIGDETTGMPGARPGNRMTVGGAVNKSWLLLGILVTTFALSWSWVSGSSIDLAMTLTSGASIVALIVALVTSFKPHLAAVGGPAFAAVEGVALGAASYWFEIQFPGIAFQAALGTLAVFGTMLGLWKAGIVRLGSRGRRIVQTAFAGIFVFYLVSFALSFTGFQMPLVWDTGPLGIGLSLVVIGLCALMLTIDFDMIVEGERHGAPAYMEWYSAFALTVTLSWIYFEMLRLLWRLRSE